EIVSQAGQPGAVPSPQTWRVVVLTLCVRGAEPMEKAPPARPFLGSSFFAHMFFPALSPDCVDNSITAFE
ncbi:hypothetical protein A9311_21565, partial [Yersinia pestis]